MATARTNTGRSSQFVDSQGVPGQYAQQVEVVVSNVASSTYATSSVRYIPIAKNATEQYIQVQFAASRTGIVQMVIYYAMSVTNGGNLALEFDQNSYGDGDDPDVALATGEDYIVTPGSGTTRKSVTLNSLFTVTEGDDVVMKLRRENIAGDTHTGSMNIIDVFVTVG